MSNLKFHNKTGSMVTLSCSNKRAERNCPRQEFNFGLVISSEPLRDDQVFEVRIEKKVAFWSGSIEIGVASLDPNFLDTSSDPLPSSAGNMRNDTWIMSGTSILNDGKVMLDEYGDNDLDQLIEGDRVGVKVTCEGHLHFLVNGIDQGPVGSFVMKRPCYAVVDLYGKCVQIAIVDPSESTASGRSITVASACSSSDKLCFHSRCGKMIRFYNSNLSAERRKPIDEFNNGVVMTQRPLRDNELFEIRIDELVHKWSGSIEMGVTTHNPDTLVFPATMTNLRSGTVMMSGCGILTNGKGSKREYGDFNLDELREGDRIGLLRKPSGNLHYFISGMDQGVAATNIPAGVYGVVDLYGMTVKVTIMDSTHFANQSQEGAIPNNQPQVTSISPDIVTSPEVTKLLFHSRCGDYINVINGGRTLIRPNCLDEFNKAVALTNRPLLREELFQVRLKQIVSKWAGSIEIGVTTHKPEDFQFPSTMTNVRCGTWILTGNGFMVNGSTTVGYGSNNDLLKPGDVVGLIVSKHGELRFYINGIDKGVAARNIPPIVYGVVDLYGKAVKASIVHNTSSQQCEENNPAAAARSQMNSGSSNLGAVSRSPKSLGKPEVDQINENCKAGISRARDGLLHCSNDANNQKSPPTEIPATKLKAFHPVFGKNIILRENGNRAHRVGKNYQNSIVFSLKPLENEGHFEVYILTINDDWYGSFIMGLTDFVPTSSDSLPEMALAFKNCRSWMLFSSNFYVDGKLARPGYAGRFRRSDAGDRISVIVDKNRTLRFAINGKDKGVAATNLPRNLYVVCDLYGSIECINISKCHLPIAEKFDETKLTEELCFHNNHGTNVELLDNNRSARRVSSYNQALVLTNRSLKRNELFEIKINSLNAKWTSSVRIGVTNQNPEELKLPVNGHAMLINTWIVSADSVVQNGKKIGTKYGCNLESLLPNQTFGVKVDEKGNLRLFVNGEDEGIAATDILFPCWGIVDLYGQCTQICLSNIKPGQKFHKENDEKGDNEADVKESLSNPALPKNLLMLRNCKFRNTCTRLKNVIYPDFFFLNDHVDCFCDVCHLLRIEEINLEKDGNHDESQPLGWCRFGLRSSKLERAMTDNWPVAFHGTRLGYVRQILDNQTLLPTAELGLQCFKPPKTPAEKESANISSHVVISPSIQHAGSLNSSPKAEIYDPETKRKVAFQTAFQVFVHPASYSAFHFEKKDEKAIDTHSKVKNKELEWYTKEKGSTVLYGLLMKLID